MRSVQNRSDSNPLSRNIPAEVLDVLFKAQAAGLLSRPVDIFRLDLNVLRFHLKEIAEAGIGRGLLRDIAAWSFHDSQELANKLRLLDQLLEESPKPDKEWPAVRRIIPDSLLMQLLGNISETSLRRYAQGERDTPVDVAARLHFLALTIGDLSGSYDDLGVNQWFTRPRPQAFAGKTPRDLLSGNWQPYDPGPTKVRQFARSLNYCLAT